MHSVCCDFCCIFHEQTRSFAGCVLIAMTAGYLFLLLLSLLYVISAFNKLSNRPNLQSVKSFPMSSISANMMINPSMLLADGLDADTLNALGDIQEIEDAVDAASDSTAAIGSIVTQIVDSPIILAVPIGAGLLVAFGLGFFIFSYSRGKEVSVN